MKKIISILLVVLMLFSLVACGSSNTEPEKPAEPDTPAPSEQPAEPDDSAEPAEPADEGGITSVTQLEKGCGWDIINASDDATLSASKVSAQLAADNGLSTVGWYSDDVDWQGRDPYKIMYIYGATMVIHTTLCEAIRQDWVSRLNIEFEQCDCNSNIDTMLTNVETYATLGYDGLMVDPDPQISERMVELCAELEMPWMPMWNPICNTEGVRIYPGVSLDSAYCGEMEIKWLEENYTRFWGDIDTSKLGCIFIFATSNQNFIDNMDGAKAEFTAKYPEGTFFEADTLAEANPYNTEAGYNVSGALMAAHKEIEYWFVATCLEDVGQGAARAAESQGIDDKVLVVTNGANILIPAWRDGSESGTCWVAGLHYGMNMLAEPVLCGLIALIEGRATPDNLFVEWIKPGETGANVRCDWRIVGEDEYQDYLDYIDAYLAR